MQLDRKAFLKALSTAAPALSSRELVPLLRYFWFSGSVVRATDGIIGIEATCGTAFTGGLPGAVLLGFVESLDADTLTAEYDPKKSPNTITFICGKAKIKLPLEPMSNTAWPFEYNDPDPDGEIPLDAEWRKAFDFAMISVTNNAENEQRRGLTISPTSGGQGLNLYSTDGASISWAKMDVVDWQPDELTIPGVFVQEMLKLMSAGGRLMIRTNMVEAANEEGVRVFSKLPEIAEPMAFGEVLRRNLKDVELVQMPDGFKAALERSELLKDIKEGVPAKLTVTKNNTFVIEASSSFGDLHEELELLEVEGMAPVSMYAIPNTLLRALSNRTHLSVSEKCVIMSGPENFTYLAAAYRAKDSN